MPGKIIPSNPLVPRSELFHGIIHFVHQTARCRNVTQTSADSPISAETAEQKCFKKLSRQVSLKPAQRNIKRRWWLKWLSWAKTGFRSNRSSCASPEREKLHWKRTVTKRVWLSVSARVLMTVDVCVLTVWLDFRKGDWTEVNFEWRSGRGVCPRRGFLETQR